MSKTAYFWDPISLEHDTGRHVECIARAERLRPDRIVRPGSGVEALPIAHRDAADWVVELHTARYRDWVHEACIGGKTVLDQGDTVVCDRSYDAALGSVAAALSAADAVMTGGFRSAFSAMRPPGHHARPAEAMGFCLFGNVAILARYLQKKHGLKRIAIVDWDVHHGNGTQEMFYRDGDVFFVSLHQSPLWPGSGAPEESGEGAGRGATLNIPIAPGTSESEYLGVFEERVVPAVRSFAPECILISAGFDAHTADPLGDLRLTETGFAQLARRLKEIAEATAKGRLIACLEGGYNLDALEASVATVVATLAED